VPVFGVADGEAFHKYRLEYGEGAAPRNWRLVRESSTPQPRDPYALGAVRWDPNVGAHGNLGDWDTGLTSYTYGKQRENLNGVCTLRLVAEDRAGKTVEARVTVTVAREVTRVTGGIGESVNGKAFVNVPEEGITTAFLLISIQPIDAVDNPPLVQIKPPKDLIQVGSIYEFQPPGEKFLRPVLLRIRYEDGDLRRKSPDGREAAIPEAKLGIYAYMPFEEFWRRLPCQVVQGANEVRTELRESTAEITFYAVFADLSAPDPPVLLVPSVTVERSRVRLTGRAEPFCRIELVSGDEVVATGQTDAKGGFEVPSVRLKPGSNTFHAVAVDGATNRSQPSPPVAVTLQSHPPTHFDGISFLGGAKATRRGKFLVKLVGKDASPQVNVVPVRVFSETDPKGCEIELEETGPTTGVFVAEMRVSAKSASETHSIAASRHGEAITVATLQEPPETTAIRFEDTEPPPAPAVTCPSHPSLCQDGFEDSANPLGEWANVDGEFGAALARESYRGNTYLKLTKAQAEGHLGAWARRTPYSALRFPLVCFDYLINPEVKMDLQVKRGGWELIEFNDATGECPRFGRKAIASFRGVRSDGQWHSTEFSLGSVLAARSPGDSELKVEGIQFINWDKPAYMKLQFGRTGQKGSYWCVGNFRILGFGGPKAEFKWSSEDENGIAGYSYVFDQKPDTIPPEKSMGMVTENAFDGLTDGRWYLHVRAVDKPGNWGPTNHYMTFVDTKPPTAQPIGPTGKVASDTPIRIQFDDSNGSGVNPYSIRLKVGGTVYTTDNDALSFDPDKQVLTFDPKAHTLRSADGRSAEKLPLLFADGEKVEVELVAAADHAKHAMAKLPPWSYEVSSPLKVASANPDGKNSWYVSPPKIEMKAPEGSKVEYAWAVPVEEDDLFRKGNSINRLTITVTGKDGKAQRYVKPFRLDTTVPKVTAKVIPEKPGPDGVYAKPPTIVLSHDDYATIEGGLSCEGYATEDCTGAPLFRQERVLLGAFEPPADVADEVRSVRWTGRLRPPETGIYKLWLGCGRGQRAQVFVNRELVLDSTKAKEGEQEVGTELLLVRKMHALDLRWLKAGKGNPGIKLSWQKEKADNREDVPADAIFFLRSLAKVYYHWNEGKEAEHTTPLTAPPGRHVLRFRAIDEAGHAGKEETVTIETAAR